MRELEEGSKVFSFVKRVKKKEKEKKKKRVLVKFVSVLRWGWQRGSFLFSHSLL